MRVVGVVVAIGASTGCDGLFRVDGATPVDAGPHDGTGNGDGSGNPPACLDDTFGGMTIDSNVWSVEQPSGMIGIHEGGGALEFTIPPTVMSENSIFSKRHYDMTGGYLVVELKSATLDSSATVGIDAEVDFNDYFEIDVSSTELNFATYIGGVFASGGTSQLLAQPMYLRIHHTGSAMSYETSPDGMTWTPQHVESMSLPVSSVTVVLYGESFASNASVSTGDFANVRLVGPGCP